ncbi:ATP synthase F1 subunit epsilon [Acetobacteraceae bacterium KSS8]|uniref:ATP synthase epsilon chain n=1 Tax=Endosaccharibacter trunci TaxID=2812733 RepID=A0ABT1W6J9_9PROT|nr:ATP synthase F1 subunit epsilon [Acetobacteraceae bacterium KSS8]
MPIDVEIVSPEKRLLSRAVEMVVMPGSEGDLAAMQDHAPTIVLLRGGVVSLYDTQNVTGPADERFFVAGGFAEITGSRCTILADSATPVAELSRAEGETRLRDAETAYDDADKSDVPALEPLLERIQSARAQIETAEAN